MKTSDLLKMCVQNLRRRKFRTLLTVVGVVIGTAAIISMISLGIGINQSTNDLISQWGDLTVIEVWGNWGGDIVLNDNVLSDIKGMDGVAAVTPFSSLDVRSTITAGKGERYKMEYPNISGVYPEALIQLDYKFSEGELKASDGKGKKIPIVLGSEALYDFEDTRKRIDNRVWPEPDDNGVIPDPLVNIEDNSFVLKIPYTVDNGTEKYLEYELDITGVLSSDGAKTYEQRYGIFLDTKEIDRINEDYRKITKEKSTDKPKGYQNAKIKVKDMEQVTAIQTSVEEMGFGTYSTESERKSAMESTQRMQLILGGLGGVSLFVAAISIANTMVMSVYERTREIGIMKVLGCFVNDIRSIFLVEAALIGFFGGLIGVALSYLISFILNNFGGSLGDSMGMMGGMMYYGEETAAKLSIIPPWLVALGMIFATLVGIAAGVYPASRAVKISALEAIKQE